MRPVIGITSYAEEVTWGSWVEPAALIPLAYVKAIEKAGGRPLVVPPSDEAIEETLAVLDGILFSGGSDLDPELYGAELHPETTGVREDRDRAEMALLAAALERDMPVLAVCRGSQVLNVARGGDLVQHLPEEVGHEGHKHLPGEWSDHDVKLEPASRVGGLLEAKKIAGMAEVQHVQIAPHLYCGPVVGAANIQLATCSPNFLILESIERWDGFHAEILKKPVRWEQGYVIPPTEPGLGVVLNEEFIARYPYTGSQLHLDMAGRPI